MAGFSNDGDKNGRSYGTNTNENKRKLHNVLEQHSEEIIQDALACTSLQLSIQKNQLCNENKKLKVETTSLTSEMVS